MLRPTASLASALNLLVQGVNFLSDLEHSVSKRKATERSWSTGKELEQCLKYLQMPENKFGKDQAYLITLLKKATKKAYI